RYLPALVLSVVAPVVVLGWIVWVDPWSAVIIGVTVLVLPIFMVLLGVEASGRMRTTWGATTRLTGHFADVARGMRTLRSFNRAEAQVEVLETAGEDLRRLTMGTLRIALLSSFTLELLSSLATAIVALTLGLRLLGGHIGLATALGVLLVTPEVYLPLRRASAQFHDATDGVGAASELLDLLEQRPTTPVTATSSGAQVIAALRDGRSPSIDLVDVAISHDDTPVWRSPLSVHLDAGATLNVTGASGAGKSTLLALLLGHLTPDSGTIYIDEVPLAELDLMAWRQAIGWLPQAPTFPGATIADVVRMRQPDLSDDAVADLLAQVGLGALATGPRDLLRMPAVEAVRALSAGERHRLAVLRAVLGQPRLLLLDEPGAHLDPESIASVGALLSRRAASVTTVVVSHEESTLLTASSLLEISGWSQHHG
ncbi:MAG: ATP-binding cassette domain-containing protein, partial [Actinomycetes bacterium]